MTKVLTRYDILIKKGNENNNLDFILNSTNKNVIHGVVWNDDFENPERVAEALVQVFKPGKNYENDPLDIKLIGYVITDNCGNFIVGPFEVGTMVILKVFKFWGNNADEDEEGSFQVNDGSVKVLNVEI